MKELKAVPEIVKNVKVSADKIRYWISLLGAKTIRKGRISFIPFAIAAQIEMMAHLIANGISPKEAAQQPGGKSKPKPKPKPKKPTKPKKSKKTKK